MLTTGKAKAFPLGHARRQRKQPLSRFVGSAFLGLLLSCATAPTPPSQVWAVRSHVYPLPLDNVLAQAKPLLEKEGFAVKRIGSVLVTNWLGGETGIYIAYRVYGERIDAGLCSLRIERVVASQSTSFNTDHPITVDDRENAGWLMSSIDKASVRDAMDDKAVGTAPPPASYSPEDLAPPSAVVVTQRGRDAEMERRFQEEIDPTGPTATEHPAAGMAVSLLEPRQDIGVAPPPAELAASAPPVSNGETRAAERAVQVDKLTGLAGIWEGTFQFRGNVTGSYTGEVTVAAENGAAEITDFCPERGAPLTVTGSGDFAAWQGELACPPIRVQGCSSAVIKYNFAHAMMNGDMLTLVAAGDVNIPGGCGEASGALSVTFSAKRAHYLYLAVNRTKDRTTCEWPSDWENLESPGSMAMPEPPASATAYLGIIRAKGSREGDIDVLLRHCRHRVLLNGEPVSMGLAVVGPRQTPLR